MKVYPITKKAIAEGYNLSGADLRAILVDLADYTYSAAHDFLDDVPSAARVAVSTSLTGFAATVSGDNVQISNTDKTISAVTGDPVEAVIIFDNNGGADSARRLIAYITKKQDGTTDIAFTPNGSDVLLDFLAAGWLEW